MLPMGNRQDLSDWLQKEMNSRDWSQSDLARRSGLHRAVISKIVLGGSKPTPETLESIAKALKIPPEQIYRVAGILPDANNYDPWIEEQAHKLSLIPASMRGVAGRFIESVIASEEPKPKPRKVPSTK